ncbi:unnamed protein product [Ranitomeya imitator]|uniref:Ig-like domain-containing protein n=1 Tax=Ranitomeya imitator TaxID=111125 RepID=A0ABN9LP90_9NEOB|nr:unnamed protein product [Ranitomeya imitator]
MQREHRSAQTRKWNAGNALRQSRVRCYEEQDGQGQTRGQGDRSRGARSEQRRSDDAEKRHRLAFSFAFFGAMRIGELVSPSKKVMGGILAWDVLLSERQVEFWLRRSKTDQEGRREEQITKVTGSSVTFRASGDVQPSEITWLKNEIKIVDLEEGKKPDFYGFYNIKDRVDLNLTEKTFILRDVSPEDSGLYKAVLLVNGRITDLFSVCWCSCSNLLSVTVIPQSVCKVSVQTMTVWHNVTLSCSCSSDGARPSQYKWRNVSHRVSDQQNLTVSMGKEPQTLWCVASNEVSSSEATVTVPRRGPEEEQSTLRILEELYAEHHTPINGKIPPSIRPRSKKFPPLSTCANVDLFVQMVTKDLVDIPRIPECLSAISSFFTSRFLNLNVDKTELIIFPHLTYPPYLIYLLWYKSRDAAGSSCVITNQ